MHCAHIKHHIYIIYIMQSHKYTIIYRDIWKRPLPTSTIFHHELGILATTTNHHSRIRITVSKAKHFHSSQKCRSHFTPPRRLPRHRHSSRSTPASPLPSTPSPTRRRPNFQGQRLSQINPTGKVPALETPRELSGGQCHPPSYLPLRSAPTFSQNLSGAG